MYVAYACVYMYGDQDINVENKASLNVKDYRQPLHQVSTAIVGCGLDDVDFCFENISFSFRIHFVDTSEPIFTKLTCDMYQPALENKEEIFGIAPPAKKKLGAQKLTSLAQCGTCLLYTSPSPRDS